VARKQVCGTQIFGVALLACLFAAAFAPPLWAQKKKSAESAVSVVETEIRQTRGALDSIRAELERGRARVRELQNEEGNYLTRLEQIERNISVSGRYMELVQRQIDTTEKTLNLLGDSLVRAESGLQNARALMKKRLRSAYMMGEVSKMQMLLTARNPSEFVHRVRYFQDLNRYDKRLAETIRESIVDVNGKKAAEEESRQSLVKLLGDKRKEQVALVEEEASRRSVLEDVRTKKNAFAAMVEELEESQRELDAIIKVLEGRRKKAKEEEERKALINFESRKGKLGWPVVGDVVTKFGKVVHPVYKTVITSNGIDIAAKKGAPVRSVAPGSVAHVGSMRGLGRFVIVDHSGGFITVYAHLNEITVALNDDIAIGAELGKVGETGTASGAKLHFEVRKAAESLDPEEWLEK